MKFASRQASSKKNGMRREFVIDPLGLEEPKGSTLAMRTVALLTHF